MFRKRNIEGSTASTIRMQFPWQFQTEVRQLIEPSPSLDQSLGLCWNLEVRGGGRGARLGLLSARRSAAYYTPLVTVQHHLFASVRHPEVRARLASGFDTNESWIRLLALLSD